MRIQLSKDLTRLTAGVDPFFFSNPPFDPVELSESMMDFVHKNKGMNITYPQLNLPGNFSVLAMCGETENYVMFNSRIVDCSEEKITLDEVCLSFPNLIIPVKRPKSIKIRFQAPDGDTYTKIFYNLNSRIFQNAFSCIEGKYFFEGVSRLKLEKAIKKAKKLGFDYSHSGLLKGTS